MAKNKKTKKKKPAPKPKAKRESGATPKAAADSGAKLSVASDVKPKGKDNKKDKAKTSQSVGIGERIKRIPSFLRDVRGEMKRVTWPGRKQLLASTSAVLVAIVVLGLYIGLLDWGFRSIAGALNI